MLQLPNHLASTVRRVAEKTRRPVEEILVEWLDQVAADLPIESLDDEQVLALANLQFSGQQQAQLSALLAKNREEVLTELEQQRLDGLMQLYRRGLTRKAEALKVAVERGILPPLS